MRARERPCEGLYESDEHLLAAFATKIEVYERVKVRRAPVRAHEREISDCRDEKGSCMRRTKACERETRDYWTNWGL